MSGVDMTTDPLFLPQERLAGATNMVFEEGTIKTRPGFRYHDLGIKGAFQGAAVYSPSRGLSHQPFADPYTALVVAAGGKLNYNLSDDGFFHPPVEITGEDTIGCEDINLFQAENYLIVHNSRGNTLWWEGYGPFTISPGLDATPDSVNDLLLQSDLNVKELVGANIDCCFQKISLCEVTPIEEPEEDFSSHDSLIWQNHRNFLINSAGLGAYAHGRIHQDSGRVIYVSDLIHKRGTKFTDDILLMEEQQAGAFGDPLSTNSRLGKLRALEVLPAMNSANGDGILIAYYDTGVVSFDTAAVPRETRFDPVENTITQKGWSEIRQVNHMLNRVSATGRYAVGILPRDHAFRSRFGIHLLRTSLGEGSFNDEYINTLSQDVQPILDADIKSSLKGTTVGQWVEGHRLLTSVGMVENRLFTSSAMARGFVVWNQAVTFTEDRTPRPMWEGLWSPHCEIAGIHRLLDVSPINGENLSGFVASKDDSTILFGEIDSDLGCDILDDSPVQIEWNVTSRKIFNGFDSLNKITEGRVELEASGEDSRVRVMVRSDISPTWSEWHTEDTSDSDNVELFSINLGQPPKEYREASWFQFRVEGLGSAKLRALEVEMSQERGKMGKRITTHDISEKEESFHKINTKPTTDRWS
jgi:hypothetical protein